MRKVRLGRTKLTVNFNGFGALPIQRISEADAGRLLLKAYNSGFNYFDTARFYTDSEAKLGKALSPVRDNIVISTKTAAKNATEFWRDLETSLGLLKTKYIDIYQFHNPPFVPKPEDGTGLYEAMLQARSEGKIRFIGITNHDLGRALEAVHSGLYDTLQFPLSFLSSYRELALARLCNEHDVGLIAMKALAGGLITDAALAYAYLARYGNIEPIWGLQRENELDDFIGCSRNPPTLTDDMLERIATYRQELSGDFCRGCGYCLPCPAGIDIPNCARMSLLLRRAPLNVYLTPEWENKMSKIKACRHCGHCQANCPYGLDTPALLRRNYNDFQTFAARLHESKETDG